MFLRTLDALPARTRVKARFEIEGRPVIAEAEVVYQCNLDEGPYKEPGMGVKFLKVGPEEQAVIKAFVMEEIDKKAADKVAQGGCWMPETVFPGAITSGGMS
jgi:hypothetical protein